jgi:hypothetical protein
MGDQMFVVVEIPKSATKKLFFLTSGCKNHLMQGFTDPEVSGFMQSFERHLQRLTCAMSLSRSAVV